MAEPPAPLPPPPPLAPAARAARRVGLLGGSFDPPHAGHLHAARAARAALGLDHVLFVPAARPPHKRGRALAPAAERVAMLELLLEDEPAASVWTGELARPGPSYTLDTVRALEGLLAPGAELFLVLGSDNLAGLPAWHEAEELLARARPVVVHRPGEEPDPAALAGLSPEVRERVRAGLVAAGPCDASSTELRRRLARGEDSAGALPPGLERFVRERGLYR